MATGFVALRYRSVTAIVALVGLKRRRSLRQKVPLAPAARPTAGMIDRDPLRAPVACRYTGSCVRLSMTDAYTLIAFAIPASVRSESAVNARLFTLGKNDASE